MRTLYPVDSSEQQLWPLQEGHNRSITARALQLRARRSFRSVLDRVLTDTLQRIRRDFRVRLNPGNDLHQRTQYHAGVRLRSLDCHVLQRVSSTATVHT